MVRNVNGLEFGLSNILYIKLRDLGDYVLLEGECEKLDLKILKTNKYMPLWIVVESNSPSMNTIELSNYINELGIFEIAEPNFISADVILSSYNDPLYSEQWNLINIGQNNGTEGIDINFIEASKISTGSDEIAVAVIDIGVDPLNPDLINVLPGYDTESGTAPAQIYEAFGENHGTMCAGVIGSSGNNNIGLVGVSPNCEILPISFRYPFLAFENKIAEGINWAW